MSGISRFSPEEKSEIVLLCLRNPDKISEICREKGVAPVTYNKWKRKYLCGGLDAMSKVGNVNGVDLRTKNEKLEATIGHLYVELLTLKKKLEAEL
jgi:transposase-like protein